MVFFSVIIPTCNRNDNLAQCLEALQEAKNVLQFERRDLCCEVIVSDDGPAPNAEGLIAEKFTWAKWIDGPKRGPAANRNNAAKNASGKWLVFVDDDCIPSARWLAAFAIFAEPEEYPVLEGKTMPQGRQMRADDDCPTNLSGGFLWSCNFAIRRSVFLEIGGFDDSFPFPAMEDVDLHYRIRKNQLPIKFVPDGVVEHPWRVEGDNADLLKRVKTLDYFIRKHPETEPMFSKSWGFRRVIRILVFEFPQNILRFGNKGSLRKLYLDLCFSFYFFRIRVKRRIPALNGRFPESAGPQFFGPSGG
jgi:GT2 family glycosyltransferase